MPTSAATGTKQMRTTSKRVQVDDDTRTDSEREADENAAAARREIADMSANGSIQVVAADGRMVNVDASQPGWGDEVRALDPKHPVLKYR